MTDEGRNVCPRCDRTTVCVLDRGHRGPCERPGGARVVTTSDVEQDRSGRRLSASGLPIRERPTGPGRRVDRAVEDQSETSGQATRSDDWTSYGIQWCRAATRPRPDFDLSPQSMLYRTLAGDPLFTVVSHGGVPSEGIFTLIAEAPRIRDELDGRVQNENAVLVDALVLLRAARGEAMTHELHSSIAAFLEAHDA